jgi:hypothetical protein
MIDFRKALTDHLTANTEIKTWRPPYQNNAQTVKPFGVIVMGDESYRGKQGFTVHIYADQGFSRLSQLTAQVKEAMIERDQAGNRLGDRLIIAGDGRFFVEWTATSPDWFDPDIQAPCKSLEGTIPIGG